MSPKPEQIHTVNDRRHNIWPCFYGANWPELEPLECCSSAAVSVLWRMRGDPPPGGLSLASVQLRMQLETWFYRFALPKAGIWLWGIFFFFLHHCLWRLKWCAAPAPLFLWVWNFHFMPTGAQNQEMWLTQLMFPHFSQHVNCQKYSFIISFQPAFVNGSFCQGG